MTGEKTNDGGTPAIMGGTTEYEAGAPPFTYWSRSAKVRTMLTARWIWVLEHPDGAIVSVEEGTPGAERRHAVLRAGVEVYLPERVPCAGAPDGIDAYIDGPGAWRTLDIDELDHPVVAPAGRQWRCVIDGADFRLEHVSTEAQP